MTFGIFKKAESLLARSAKKFWSTLENRSIYIELLYISQSKNDDAYFIPAQNPQVDALKKRDAFCICCLPRCGRRLKRGTAITNRRVLQNVSRLRWRDFEKFYALRSWRGRDLTECLGKVLRCSWERRGWAFEKLLRTC